MTTENPPMANPVTQEICYYNEPHHWITTLGSNLPSIQVCGSCNTVNRKDLQIQLDEARAESYEDGWKKGRDRGLAEGQNIAYESGYDDGGRKAEALAEEKIEEVRRIALKQGLFEGIYRGAQVANQSHGHAAAMNEVQPTNQSAPSAPQASHKCARAMLIAMSDGTDMTIPFSQPIAQRGWKVRKMNGVDVLVIGHGVPRRTIPLCNVKFFDLLTEDDL